MLLRMFEPLCNALLPPQCVCCARPAMIARGFCTECHAELPRPPARCPRCALGLPVGGPCPDCARHPPPWQAAVAGFDYREALTQLLPHFKFHADLAAGRALAEAALPSFAAATRPDALIALPLHRARLRQRGYNQAQLIARDWACALDLPLVAGLARVRDTGAQTQRHRSERARNLTGAFAARAGLPAHLALVDDVLTTGATAAAATQALLTVGVQRVDVWVLARTP